MPLVLFLSGPKTKSIHDLLLFFSLDESLLREMYETKFCEPGSVASSGEEKDDDSLEFSCLLFDANMDWT